MVDRLERAGHINRVRDDSDRRKVFLHYSPGGRALADEFLGPVQERSDAVMDQLTPAELEMVRGFLTATGAAMTAFRESLSPQVARSPAPVLNPTARPTPEPRRAGPPPTSASRCSAHHGHPVISSRGPVLRPQGAQDPRPLANAPLHQTFGSATTGRCGGCLWSRAGCGHGCASIGRASTWWAWLSRRHRDAYS